MRNLFWVHLLLMIVLSAKIQGKVPEGSIPKIQVDPAVLVKSKGLLNESTAQELLKNAHGAGFLDFSHGFPPFDCLKLKDYSSHSGGQTLMLFAIHNKCENSKLI